MMTTIFSFLFSKGGMYVTGILGVVGLWFYAKNQGKKQERQKTELLSEKNITKILKKTILERDKINKTWDDIDADIIRKHPDELHTSTPSDKSDS